MTMTDSQHTSADTGQSIIGVPFNELVGEHADEAPQPMTAEVSVDVEDLIADALTGFRTKIEEMHESVDEEMLAYTKTLPWWNLGRVNLVIDDLVLGDDKPIKYSIGLVPWRRVFAHPIFYVRMIRINLQKRKVD